jgi:K+-transporting ATPase ATPase A chain
VTVLLFVAAPLGAGMARIYAGETTWLTRALGPLERLLYRVARVSPAEDMPWRRYAGAVLLFSAAGTLLTYAVQRAQHWLPLNPLGLPPVDPWVALNTAASFATNTNWQAYGGETTMSFGTQTLALTTQNFLSAAAGMAVVVVPRARTLAPRIIWASETSGSI